MKAIMSLTVLSCVELGMALRIPRTLNQARTFKDPEWANSTNTNNTMYQLSSDSDYHFEILRVLGAAPYEGSDIGETLLAANSIIPGDFESFTSVFTDLADRVYGEAQTINQTTHPVSARNALFRASTYYRSADFFNRQDWADPRLETLWTPMLDAFGQAIALLPVPGRKVSGIRAADGSFEIPAYFFPAGGEGRRPTIIMGSGYDGTQEEMYHMIGKAALERGFNVLTYEGPGQQTSRRQQGKGFIPEWEKVVTPVVDWALAQPEVNPHALGLLGLSFGGFLAPRAAAFEHRLAAVMSVDGIYDFGTPIISRYIFNPALEALFEAGNKTAFDAILLPILTSPTVDTMTRWFTEQGLWAFNTHSVFDFLTQLKSYTLEGVVDGITAPVFVADAEQDLSFAGQASLLTEKLGALATYHLFGAADGAGLHCSLGAGVLQNGVLLDWFQDVVSKRTGCKGPA